MILCCIFFLTLLLIFCSSAQRIALHFASYNGHTAVCEMLIAAKDDVGPRMQPPRGGPGGRRLSVTEEAGEGGEVPSPAFSTLGGPANASKSLT